VAATRTSKKRTPAMACSPMFSDCVCTPLPPPVIPASCVPAMTIWLSCFYLPRV